MMELQELLDRQSKEVQQMKERIVCLTGRVAELEEDLDTARKDLIKSEDMSTRLQRDIREVRRHGHRDDVSGQEIELEHFNKQKGDGCTKINCSSH